MSWIFIPFEKAIKKVTYTNKIPRKQFLPSGLYPIISQEADFINGYWDNAEDVFHTINPIVVFGDHTKIAKYIDFDFVLGADGVKILDPVEELEPKFLYYFLQYVPLDDLGYARHYRLLKESIVPIPRSDEQKRIVAILDQAFAEIEKARANAEQNLKNARELFESYLQQVFSQRGDGWNTSELFDHIKFIDYRGKTPTKTDFGLRLITAKNVRMGYLKPNPAEFVAPESYDAWMTRGIPQKGDVLFTTEAPLANVAQLDTDKKVVFAQRIITMQPDPLVINNTFLKYMLMSSPIQQLIHDKGTGATCTGIKASLLKKIPISYPSKVAEQEEYVLRLDKLDNSVKELEKIYQQKIDSLDELKKSILQKAFTGELTKEVAA
jgi:type I restriction enzyme S subunit